MATRRNSPPLGPGLRFVAQAATGGRRLHSDTHMQLTAAPFHARSRYRGLGRHGTHGVMRLGQAQPPLGEIFDVRIEHLADPRKSPHRASRRPQRPPAHPAGGRPSLRRHPAHRSPRTRSAQMLQAACSSDAADHYLVGTTLPDHFPARLEQRGPDLAVLPRHRPTVRAVTDVGDCATRALTNDGRAVGRRCGRPAR